MQGADTTTKDRSGQSNQKGRQYYTNPSLLRVNRKKVMDNAHLCWSCFKRKATEIHHVDLSRDNHDINNLIPLCFDCHRQYHYKQRRKNRGIPEKNEIDYTRLQQLRLSSSLTQAMAAQMVRVHDSTISRIERGELISLKPETRIAITKLITKLKNHQRKHPNQPYIPRI